MDDDGVDDSVGWAQNLLFIAQQRDRILGSGLRGLQLFANSDQQPILLLLLFPSPSADNSYSANSWGLDSPPRMRSHRVDDGDLVNQRLPASNFSTVHPMLHAAHQKCETTRSFGVIPEIFQKNLF